LVVAQVSRGVSPPSNESGYQQRSRVGIPLKILVGLPAIVAPLMHERLHNLTAILRERKF
jgi:hypothetical protein